MLPMRSCARAMLSLVPLMRALIVRSTTIAEQAAPTVKSPPSTAWMTRKLQNSRVASTPMRPSHRLRTCTPALNRTPHSTNADGARLLAKPARAR